MMPSSTISPTLLLLVAIIVVLVATCFWLAIKIKTLKFKYHPLLNIEAEVDRFKELVRNEQLKLSTLKKEIIYVREAENVRRNEELKNDQANRDALYAKNIHAIEAEVLRCKESIQREQTNLDTLRENEQLKLSTIQKEIIHAREAENIRRNEALRNDQANRDALYAKNIQAIEVEVLRCKESIQGEQTNLDTLREGVLLAQGAEATRQKAVLRNEQARRDILNSEYLRAREVYEKLRREVSILEENLEDISFGLYKPHYTYETSEIFKQELEKIWIIRREMLRAGKAAHCSMTWTVNGSEREGARMTRLDKKVMLRAFNGECDAAVAKVKWNNVVRMEERIYKSFDAINELGKVNSVQIMPEYFNVVLAELRLTHEYEVKKHDEKEEIRRIREQKRDEELAQREFERAKNEAAADQARYEKALASAKAEVEKSTGIELNRMIVKIRELEAKLAEAKDKMQRAQAMAEITKMGHVYVISNIGAFGEQIFKIGLTRRLDPKERVYELGGASVPFHFDIHAMIFSEDAPALEASFHRKFSMRRVNLVNARKEFFKVNLQEIKEFAVEQGLKVEFSDIPEARNYRETQAALEQAGKPNPQKSLFETFPDEIFNGRLDDDAIS